MAAASVDNDNLRRKVFNYICGRGGIVQFPILLKPPSPLSKLEASEAVAWLNKEVEENQSFFLQYRRGKPGHIESIRLRLKIRLCLTYLKSRTCRFGDGCKNFHICKAFVEGNCKDATQCGLSHSFHDSANMSTLHELGLGSLPDGALKNIIANNLPHVCSAYAEGSCQLDRNCQNLHICDKFVQYACVSEKLPCELSHEVKSEHNSLLLKKFGFAGKFSDDVLLCHILLPKGKRMKVELGNPSGISVPKGNLNDLSEEKKMPGKFANCNIVELPADETQEKGAKGKKQRGQKKGGTAGKSQGSSEKEEEGLKMNIGDLQVDYLKDSTYWSGFGPRGRGDIHQGRGDIHRGRGDIHRGRGDIHRGRGDIHRGRGDIHRGRGDIHRGRGDIHCGRGDIHQGRGRGDRGRGRGQGMEARGQAHNAAKDGRSDPKSSHQSRFPELMKAQPVLGSRDVLPEKPQFDPEEKDAETSEGPGKKPLKQKKKEKMKKGKKVQQAAGSEELAEESFDLIDLSEEHQSQSMSHVDLSIDDMLSMDDTERQSASLPKADDISLDDWDYYFGNLSSQTSQGSTLDLLAPDLYEDNTMASTAGGPNERAVARSICKEYNGTVAFPVLAKRQDLFPCSLQESEKWLRSKPRRFLLSENQHGEVEEISVISRGARLCFLYQMKKGKCPKPNCYFFHLCKEYVINGNCSFGASCRIGHDFHSKHNQPLLKKLGVADFTDNQLRNLLIASGPQVCLDYNEFFCDKGLCCSKIHVCKDFIKNKCTSEDDCGLVHEAGLSTSHTKHVLAKFNLQNVPPKGICRMLMVCEDDGEALSETQMAEHIHQDLDTFICDRFIMGRCRKGQGCQGHHYPMPYLWQYKASGEASSQWESFGASENEDIENVYCDVNQDEAVMTNISISSTETLLIDTGNNSLNINFKDMQAVADIGTVQLRRLSTKSAVELTDAPLSTKWVWYWQDDGVNMWQMYDGHEAAPDSDIQSEIESAFLGRELSYGFSTGNRNYKVFFGNKPMYQQNMDPKSYKTREVRRRPVFKSQEDVQNCTRETSEGSQNVLEGHISPTLSGLPSHWTSMKETDTFMRVKLHPSSDEYRRASCAFHRSVKGHQAVIVGIERVQNSFLWEKFSRKREQMRREAGNHDDAVEERQLFHGLSPNHVNITCKKNFNWRLYGQESATFGQGTHFTLTPSLANQSDDEPELCHYIFLADVLVGSFTLGGPMLLGPPQKCPSDPNSDFYDSCVDDVENPSVFVVFDADQFYPSFLVCYKLVAEPTSN